MERAHTTKNFFLFFFLSSFSILLIWRSNGSSAQSAQLESTIRMARKNGTVARNSTNLNSNSFSFFFVPIRRAEIHTKNQLTCTKFRYAKQMKHVYCLVICYALWCTISIPQKRRSRDTIKAQHSTHSHNLPILFTRNGRTDDTISIN